MMRWFERSLWPSVKECAPEICLMVAALQFILVTGWPK